MGTRIYKMRVEEVIVSHAHTERKNHHINTPQHSLIKLTANVKLSMKILMQVNICYACEGPACGRM